jgi:hypothetical protein
MGYYSSFEVVETDIDDILDVLNEFCESNWGGSFGFEFWGDRVHSYDSCKWYDWLTDLRDLATMYPDKFLVLERCGEESPDISRAVVKNGTVREIEPELVWPKI